MVNFMLCVFNYNKKRHKIWLEGNKLEAKRSWIWVGEFCVIFFLLYCLKYTRGICLVYHGKSHKPYFKKHISIKICLMSFYKFFRAILIVHSAYLGKFFVWLTLPTWQRKKQAHRGSLTSQGQSMSAGTVLMRMTIAASGHSCWTWPT